MPALVHGHLLQRLQRRLYRRQQLSPGGIQAHAAPAPLPAPVPQAAAPIAPMAQTASGPIAVVEEKSHVVTSPFVGTFYRRPGPDAPEYVRVNDRVKKGQALCIVEAMKLMNEIEADRSGVIKAILAEDGQPVEYGEPLFIIE